MKELYQKLNNIKLIPDVQEQAKQLFNFAFTSGVDSLEELYGDCIVRKSTVCADIANSANEGNLMAIRAMTQGINDWSAEYFKVDGYDNYETLTREDLLSLIQDMESELNEE